MNGSAQAEGNKSGLLGVKEMDFHVASVLFLIVSWGTVLLFLIINFTGYTYANKNETGSDGHDPNVSTQKWSGGGFLRKFLVYILN